MTRIKTKKGLDIPIQGNPSGEVQALPKPKMVALNFAPFEDVRFRLLAKAGESVKLGQSIAVDKSNPARVFVAPAAGKIKEVIRGYKRRLLDVVIEVDDKEDVVEGKAVNIATSSRDELVSALLKGGLFAHIRQRPFNTLADPTKTPRSIFVKALESAPFVPPAELQVKGKEKEFAAGLEALSKLTDGCVHLVYREGSDCEAFTTAQHVERHSASGPHPISNSSLHIHILDPISTPEDVVWTVTALDVVAIGHYLLHATPYTDKIISIAGSGILDDKRGYFRVRNGYPIGGLIAGRVPKGQFRFISGDPLMGDKVTVDDYLGFNHTAFVVIPESTEREFLHFFRLGVNKFSASGTYLSGKIKDKSKREYVFSTSTHGEHRGFITNVPYDAVMPMQIPTLSLIKALVAEDYETADELGLLEVDAEDFALSTFVCPSKSEMTEIVKKGLSAYHAEVLA